MLRSPARSAALSATSWLGGEPAFTTSTNHDRISLDRPAFSFQSLDTKVAFSLSIPREQPLAQPAKPEIGRKADDPDHKDTGKDALGAKGLLRLQYHVAHTDGRPDHLGGDDYDQG